MRTPSIQQRTFISTTHHRDTVPGPKMKAAATTSTQVSTPRRAGPTVSQIELASAFVCIVGAIISGLLGSLTGLGGLGLAGIGLGVKNIVS